jgi:hypothetical protein
VKQPSRLLFSWGLFHNSKELRKGKAGMKNKKKCSKCNEVLSLERFSPAHGSKNITRPECRQCSYKLTKVRKELKERYGSAPNDYECPICLKKESQLIGTQGGAGKSVWVIDHCHTTDKFRGFLCHNCNRGIGVFKDDLKRLHRAVRYLKG